MFRSSRARIIGLALALLALSFMAYRLYQDWQVVGDVIHEAQPSYLLLSFLVLQLSLGLFAVGWHVIVNAFAGVSELLSNVAKLSIANLAKNLPTPVWYIGGRVQLYGETGYPRDAIVFSSLVEMFLHVVTGAAVLGSLLVITSTNHGYLLTGVVLLVPLAISLLRPTVFSHVLQWWRTRRGDQREITHIDRRLMFQLVVVYAVTWLNGLLFIIFLVHAWGQYSPSDWWILWRVWLIASMAGYASTLLLGGLGLFREISLTLLLARLMPMPEAVAIAASSRLILIVGEALWGLVFLVRRRALYLGGSE